ncbi:penicillin-binding protein [Micrococcales bacterium 31B]|nr:penicillin-binding protein [Micrococcales bacterium 31B]
MPPAEDDATRAPASPHHTRNHSGIPSGLLSRRAFVGITVAAGTLGLASCTDGVSLDGQDTATAPSPDAAAKAFAAALAQGDLATVPVRGYTAEQATAQIAAALGDLADHKPTVTVKGVQAVDTMTVTATFTVAWDLKAALPPAGRDTAEPTTWTYDTTAEFVFVNGQWAATWNITALAPELNGTNKLTIAVDTTSRGTILGGNDQPIVRERPVYRVGLDKTQVEAANQEASARAIAAIVDIDADAYAQQVAAAGPQQFVVAITLRQDAIPDLLEQLGGVQGAFAPAETLDLAPTAGFAAQILGRVGEATAEMVEQSDGALTAGDYTGLSGLQLAYNDLLRGRPGLRVVLADNPEVTAAPTPNAASAAAGGSPTTSATTTGRPINSPTDLFTIAGAPGTPLQTTLNEGLQSWCETALQRFPATPSAIVVLQPSSGSILAVATGPASPGFSTATLGQYPPGSTFKVASALAALRAGLTLDTPVECPATVTVDGRSFKNDDGYPAAMFGTQPLLNVIKYSCNTGFVNLGSSVPQADLVTAAATLGIGQSNTTGIPAYFGAVPATATATEHAASMFGQGQVLASPLAMATVAASVGAGRLVTPVFVRNVPTPADAASASPSASSPSASPSASPSPAPALAAGEAQSLQTAMQAVVQGGTASVLAELPAPAAGAKTGTAQYGNDNPPKVHAWMIAYHGDLAACVFVEDGDYGATTSGPVMKELLTAAPGILAATPAPPPPSTSPSSSATTVAPPTEVATSTATGTPTPKTPTEGTTPTTSPGITTATTTAVPSIPVTPAN